MTYQCKSVPPESCDGEDENENNLKDEGRACPPVGTPKDCDMSVADLASGSLIHSQPLFDGLSLHYNSYEVYSGTIAPKWRLSAHITLERPDNGTGKVIFTEGNGESRVYSPPDVGATLFPDSYLSEEGESSTLERDGTHWTVTELDGAFYNFSGSSNSFFSNPMLLSITDLDGRRIFMTYSSGLLTAITDSEAIGPATIGYNNGIIDYIYDPQGNKYDLDYEDNNLKEVIYPLPKTISGLQAPDSTGTLQSFTYPETGATAPKWTYTYFEHNNDIKLQDKTDLSGLKTKYYYDLDKVNWTRIYTDYGNREKSLEYDRNYSDHIGETVKTERDGSTWKYRYNKSDGRLREKEDPEESITYYNYTTNQKTVTYPGDKRKTTTRYDGNRNVTAVIEKDLVNFTTYSTTYTYNGYGQVLTMTEPLDGTGESGASKTTVYTYDSEGRITSVYDGYNSSLFYHYSTVGADLEVTLTDPRGKETVTLYDDKARIESVTLPGGAKTEYVYDANGNLDYTDGPLSGDVDKTEYTYDSLNQLVQVIAPGGIRTTYTYHPDGSVKKVIDPEGKVTAYGYTKRGQQDEITDAAGNITEMAYGDAGCATCGGVDKLTSLKDANLKVTRYAYDSLGRLTAEMFGNATTVSYDYIDPYKYTKTNARGIVVTYESNYMGRLIKKKADGNVVEEYSYYDNGWLHTAAKGGLTYTYEYYPDGRVKEVHDGTRTITYGYDAAGNRTSMTVSGLSDANMTYTYTDDGLPDSLVSSSAGTFNYDYTANGKRDKLTYPNGVEGDYQYDGTTGRLSGIVHKKGATTVTSSTYTHYDSGNRKTRTKDDGTETTVSTYLYDKLYRLKDATHVRTGGTVEGTQFEHYSTDVIGNRLREDSDLLDNYFAGFDPYSTNHYDQYDFTYYDIPGKDFDTPFTEMADETDYVYDYENRLTKVTRLFGNTTTTVTYSYDVYGRRVGRTVTTGGVQTADMEYVYDNEDIIAVYEGGSLSKVFIHGPGIDEPLAVKTGGSWYYYHADGLGSVMSLTNASGQPVEGYSLGYDSFGNLVKGTLDRNYTYTGREWDAEAGLYYYRVRFYDPETGRFISNDPIGFDGGDVNLYSYVGQNPLNWIDPWGLHWTTNEDGVPTFEWEDWEEEAIENKGKQWGKGMSGLPDGITFIFCLIVGNCTEVYPEPPIPVPEPEPEPDPFDNYQPPIPNPNPEGPCP